MLNELSIHNYKSIRNVQLSELPPLCVLVGANAAGKSNFADALDFLSLVSKTGLAGAVRAKGGYENICFRRAKRSKAGLTFHVRANVSLPEDQQIRTPRKGRLPTFAFSYDFTFSTPTRAIVSEYEVTHETVKLRSEKGAVLTVERHGTEIPTARSEPSTKKEDWFLPLEFLQRYVKQTQLAPDELLLTSRLSHFPPFVFFIQLLSACGVYQISPHVARETGIPERSAELGRHGENLPAAVNYLDRFQPQAFQELLEHVTHTVPTIEGLSTSYVETKQLGLFFKEVGVGRRWFSHDVSDGTIQAVSIFLPLVDPRKRILFIEEPENSLHPWMLRHFMDSCKQHSADKQILITTQSLVAVDESPTESLYIVSRHNGETRIDRCIDANPELSEAIREQLMGLGEYWDSGAIAGVPEYDEQLRLIDD